MRIVGGKYRRRRFDVPKSFDARPTTDMAKESLFNVLSNLIDFDGIKALDLFAGTGAISFELVSRGAKEVICIEKNFNHYRFIHKVKAELDAPELRPIKGDVFKFIKNGKLKNSFDFIFADPPYDLPNFAEVPQAILDNNLLADGGILVVEHSSQYNFSTLPYFAQHRDYGSVNFSIFIKEEAKTTS